MYEVISILIIETVSKNEIAGKKTSGSAEKLYRPVISFYVVVSGLQNYTVYTHFMRLRTQNSKSQNFSCHTLGPSDA